MKNSYLLFLTLFVLFFSGAEKSSNLLSSYTAKQNKASETNSNKDLQGAWTTSFTNEYGQTIRVTTIVMDGYLAETYYNVKTNEFIKTFGGSWTVDKNIFTLTTEFSSSDSTTVGTSRDVLFELKGDTITFRNDEKIWTRIDHGESGDLAGAWLFSGRVVDGKTNRRKNGPRKTMKILSETRFQWIAYNTETGKFSGTGGGTYTAKNGKYTEQIAFFSRDNSRVGASLSFDYEVKVNEWHHNGLSSKGKPIYEIWSPRILPDKNTD